VLLSTYLEVTLPEFDLGLQSLSSGA
jgi:hypothetical protein